MTDLRLDANLDVLITLQHVRLRRPLGTHRGPRWPVVVGASRPFGRIERDGGAGGGDLLLNVIQLACEEQLARRRQVAAGRECHQHRISVGPRVRLVTEGLRLDEPGGALNGVGGFARSQVRLNL